jgi:phage/plasmid-associated DNA primase
MSWGDAVKMNAKNEPTGLNASVIANLIYQDCARIDMLIFKVENNIGRILTVEDLKTIILEGLRSVQAQDLYSTTTYPLVRDQLLPLLPVKKLGTTEGFIPMKNGVLDVCKGEIVPVEDIYLKTTNIDFNPMAVECPKIQQMLDNMFLPEQKELVLSIIGAALSGRRAPFILALSGAGRNGKSLFREILEALMMEMITTEKLENLGEKFVNEVFMGKKISWQTEVSSKRAFVDQIKEITGGTTIQIRQKNVNGTFQYPLQMVCVIDTNNPPHFDNSQAINDRVRFVNMPHKFVYKLTGEPNEVLIDSELTNGWKHELPAFFNMILPYIQYYMKNGRLKYDIDGTMAELRDRSNLEEGFLHDCTEEDLNRYVDIRTLHKYYCKYAASKNISALDSGQFRHKLKKEFGLRVSVNTVQGIHLLKDVKIT